MKPVAALATAATLAAAWPADYVIVPGGRTHKSCVHEVPEGALLEETTLPLCNHPFLRGDNGTHGSAWKAWAQVNSTGLPGVSSLNSTWAVPGPPQDTNGGQTLFWWNGVEPGDTSAVLQPVLQWGTSAAGGGNYWAYSSWYVSANHGSHFSKLEKVQTGDKVTGTNTLHADGSWTISSTAPNRNPSILQFKPVAGDWPTAFHVLEAYGVDSTCNLCAQLTRKCSVMQMNDIRADPFPPPSSDPAAGKVVFNDIELAFAGTPMAPIAWTFLTQTAGCGEQASANADGSSVTISDNVR